jgi:D-glycero-alpha-D-manno-heptose-7-phosphate kinase
MILTRSPLRISLGGGGTDLPSYYRKAGGFLIAAAIQQYIYVSLHRTFVEDFILKYSEMERVQDTEEVRHPIVREALKLLDVDPAHLEITSFADIPAGTGLGSSGTFTCALLHALHEHAGIHMTRSELAEQACRIEIEKLNEPSGKQDQYISVFGGITQFTFREDDAVDVEPLPLSVSQRLDLEDSLVMFFTGYSRRASDILAEQDKNTKNSNSTMIQNLNRVKEIGYESKKALLESRIEDFGHLMHEHWLRKKQRSSRMVNQSINDAYDVAMSNGALGGKLIGAGGGGFLLFVTTDKKRTRHAMADLGLREVPVRFDYAGTQTMIGRS